MAGNSNLQEHAADNDPHGQYLREDVLQAIGDLITSTAASTPSRVAIGFPGHVFMVSLDTPFRPVWGLISTVAVPKSIFLHKGDLLVGTGPGTYAILPVGTDGQVLSADSAELTGLKWVDSTPVVTCPYGLDFSYECDSGYIALL